MKRLRLAMQDVLGEALALRILAQTPSPRLAVQGCARSRQTAAAPTTLAIPQHSQEEEGEEQGEEEEEEERDEEDGEDDEGERQKRRELRKRREMSRERSEREAEEEEEQGEEEEGELRARRQRQSERVVLLIVFLSSPSSSPSSSSSPPSSSSARLCPPFRRRAPAAPGVDGGGGGGPGESLAWNGARPGRGSAGPPRRTHPSPAPRPVNQPHRATGYCLCWEHVWDDNTRGALAPARPSCSAPPSPRVAPLALGLATERRKRDERLRERGDGGGCTLARARHA
ncbi:unnamed protein product [Lampetra fluviatilis]